MMQVNNEKVYEDLTPESVVLLLEALKSGTAKEGPQNGRINALGIKGRTSLTDSSNL